MLAVITKEEKLLWTKRKKIIYILKHKQNFSIDYYSERIEKMIFNMPDDRVQELFKLHKDKINNEIWVDCYPMYYHITEFESALIVY